MRTLSLSVALIFAATLSGGAESKSVKLVGCLDHDTPASSALATSAMQVTAFRLSAIDAAAFRAATSSAGLDASGPAELRLQDSGDFTILLDHVGRRVEVTGKFVEDPSTVRPANGLAITAQGPVPWLPVLRVSSVHKIADTCRY
jgi:hypothetical protein